MITSLKQQFVELLSFIGFLPAGLSRSALLRLARDSGDGVLQATGPKVNLFSVTFIRYLSIHCNQTFRNILDERQWRQSSTALICPLCLVVSAFGPRSPTGAPL